jgi:hypothetical protein
MTQAESILKDVTTKEDIKMVCEFHADRIKFHSSYVEYIFKDESTIIQG